jgi:hypothetical protein
VVGPSNQGGGGGGGGVGFVMVGGMFTNEGGLISPGYIQR